jgi:hypothetical protein
MFIHQIYDASDPRRPVLKKSFGQTGPWTGELRKPDCVAVDRDGFVLVADNGNRRLQVFTQEGEFVGWASSDFRWAGGLAVTDDRRIVVSDYEANRVRVIH